MQMFVLVLNKVECLERLLQELLNAGITGVTLLDSTGMMRVLDADDPDLPIFGSLHKLLNPERKGSKTMFMVLKDEQLQTTMAVINRVTGGLDQPDTGIAFSVPTLFVEGLLKNK